MAVLMSDLVEVPRTALARLVAVAAHVSLGARAAFITPYPDSLARLALGELGEAGLLEQFRPADDAAFEAHAEESLVLANEAFDAVAESWPRYCRCPGACEGGPECLDDEGGPLPRADGEE